MSDNAVLQFVPVIKNHPRNLLTNQLLHCYNIRYDERISNKDVLCCFLRYKTERNERGFFRIIRNKSLIMMGSLPDVSELRTRLENTLISYHHLEEKEWSVAKKSKDVTVWRKPSLEFSGFLYKVEGLVTEEPCRIMDYIRPGPYRLQWDSLMTSMDIVETLDKDDSAPCSLLNGYIQTDLRGKIPQSAVDIAMATSLINFYSDLSKALTT
ncbi:hypothetical protein HF521_005053 [Silurus meridionalis]|uniref:START domain-containing protein n=1 Tax=Silurus meridionalis TaxID=175797 RepID=A0A8T0AWA8_SILME|nr:hypothetical protein HF521_005053 [Silurus meridionalis]